MDEETKKVPDLGRDSVKVIKTQINLFDPPPKVEGLRLNIGCGSDIKKGFINADKYALKADAQWDILNIPLNDESLAQIICFEVLEHLSMKDSEKALAECQRLLKSGGTLVLTVPDLVSYCENIVADPENEYGISRLFGNQSHQGQFHLNGFTPKKLFKCLGNAGFKQVATAYFDITPGLRNIYCEATK